MRLIKGNDCSNISKLEILEVNCPLHLVNDPFIGDLLIKTLRLKCAGYKTASSKYFAFDKYDLVSRHFFVGHFDARGMFSPLIGFRGISKSICDYWGLPFPGLSIIENTKSRNHIEANESFIFNSEKVSQEDVGYASTLAMSPDIEDKDLKVELLRIFEVMIANFNLDFEVSRSNCIARVKQRAPEHISRVGYRPIMLNGQALPSVKVPQCINDEFMLMIFTQLSAEGKILLDQYTSLWKNRVKIDGLNKQYDSGMTYHLDEHKKAS